MRFTADFDVTKKPGRNLFQYLAMLSGTLTVISSGMHYGWPSPSLPKLRELVTNDEGSWISVMPLVGALCGSLLGSVIIDLIGRKRLVLLSTFPFFAAWLMVAYAKCVVLLIIARLMAGVADGMVFTALPIYLGEIASAEIRGSLVSSVSVTWIFGTMLINAIGSYLSVFTTALISSSLPVLCFITFMWMPESPYHLIMKGDNDEARRCLRVFKGKEDIEEEFQVMSEAVKDEQSSNGRWYHLFTLRSNRKALYVMMGTRGFQQLAGTTAITFYAYTIFESAGNVISPALASVIYFTVQMSVCSCCSLIVDKTGRRPLLITSIVGSGLTLLVEAIYFFIKERTSIHVDNLALVPIIAMILFVVLFSVGMQSIPILLLGEIFPTTVKGFAVCFADIYFSLVAAIVSKFFQLTKDNYGLHVPFFSFAGFCVLGFFFIVFYVPETKGKTLEEIQQLFKGEDGKKKLPKT